MSHLPPEMQSAQRMYFMSAENMPEDTHVTKEAFLIFVDEWKREVAYLESMIDYGYPPLKEL